MIVLFYLAEPQRTSMVHVARTIARRAERIIVRLNWTAKINEEVLILPIVYQIIFMRWLAI